MHHKENGAVHTIQFFPFNPKLLNGNCQKSVTDYLFNTEI